MRGARNLGLVVLLAAVWNAPNAAGQTNSEKVYRLGHLAPSAELEEVARRTMLPKLGKLGFVEGRNLVFDSKIGAPELLPKLAEQLASANPDAIVTVGPPATAAVSVATRSIPIVMFADDPIGHQLAETFGKPGGNVTGVTLMTIELHGKRLELLHEALPAARRIAVLLRSPRTTNEAEKEQTLRSAAARLGIELIFFSAEGPADLVPVFDRMRNAKAEALLIGSYPGFIGDAAQLAELAVAARIPSACPWADAARLGCFIGYSASRDALLVRVAHFVARIFRGAIPADLPIERPTEFELAVNLRTARALQIEVPASFLDRAGEVIE